MSQRRPPVAAWVGLGANLGDARATVISAMDALPAIEGVRVRKRSSVYTTAPVDAIGPDFVNAVVEIETSLTAPGLLHSLLALEQQFGRKRPFYHAPRTLDLDLLQYGDARIDSRDLVVPHPRMFERAFVLVPLHEIAPGRVNAVQLLRVSGQAIERSPGLPSG